ncbi:MAG: hypothetical protein WC758_08735 [Candidatus Woesearchaeota archaeon]
MSGKKYQLFLFVKRSYSSIIIPSPAINIAFKIFPTPKNLKIAKIVKQTEIKKPLLELPKVSENRKNKNINKLTKNNGTNNENLGSVK